MDNLLKIILIFGSVSLGALLGVLRSKIFASKENNKLHYFFYGFSIVSVLTCLFLSIKYSNKIDSFSIGVLIATFVLSILLWLATNKFLFFKNIYKSTELDTPVNKFTSNADKNDIKLFGGDLNFFGNSPSEIDNNSQYTHLKSLAFKKVSILCEAPHNQIQKIRYGKILHEIPYVELRFYEPETADLKVRGRIIQVQGVTKLLMYTKIKSGIYQSLETDTANSNGVLYNNIWELAWGLAQRPIQSDLDSYIDVYNGSK
jgi:hypothetical protein